MNKNIKNLNVKEHESNRKSVTSLNIQPLKRNQNRKGREKIRVLH